MKKTKKAVNGRGRVTDEAFVKAWAASASVAEVADRVGLGYSGAQARARLLKEGGVKLRKHARISRRERIDADGLNKLLTRAYRAAR